MYRQREYYSTADIARMMNRSVATVSRWCADGRIKGAFKDPGGNWLIPIDSPSILPPTEPRRRPAPKPAPDPLTAFRNLYSLKMHDSTSEKQDNLEPVLNESETT